MMPMGLSLTYEIDVDDRERGRMRDQAAAYAESLRADGRFVDGAMIESVGSLLENEIGSAIDANPDPDHYATLLGLIRSLARQEHEPAWLRLAESIEKALSAWRAGVAHD